MKTQLKNAFTFILLPLTIFGNSCKKKDTITIDKEAKDWNLVTIFNIPGARILDVCESGLNNIWVTGMGGFVANSSDNGESWTKHIIDSTLSNQVWWNSVYFISSQIGLVGGDGSVYKTTDGGKNWTPIFKPANGICWRTKLHFITEYCGIICGVYSSIFRTTDGGKSWTDLTIKSLNNVDLGTPQFINAAKGWISSKLYPTLIKTIDSGKTWTILHSMNDLIVSTYRYSSSEISVVDENNLYSAGNSLLHSTDGGIAWSETGTVCQAAYVSMKNTLEGFCLNNLGTNPSITKQIGHTYDGGKTWFFFDRPYSDASPGFGHLNKTNGHLYGFQNALYRYAKSW